MKSIIWDWNGTLLNDASFICDVANGIISRRGYKTLTFDEAREVSCHPASEWYRRMGVDFERHPFADIVTEFQRDYLHNFSRVTLHEDSLLVLSKLKERGINQYVLSAHMHSSLVLNVDAHGITEHFEEVLGLDSGHAHSKLENGKELVSRRGIGKSAVMIGDSSHDAEVASVLGVPCFLVSRGIESEKRLKNTGCPVFADLTNAVQAAGLL
jgi:phosphoglycolate phosphatase